MFDLPCLNEQLQHQPPLQHFHAIFQLQQSTTYKLNAAHAGVLLQPCTYLRTTHTTTMPLKAHEHAERFDFIRNFFRIDTHMHCLPTYFAVWMSGLLACISFCSSDACAFSQGAGVLLKLNAASSLEGVHNMNDRDSSTGLAIRPERHATPTDHLNEPAETPHCCACSHIKIRCTHPPYVGATCHSHKTPSVSNSTQHNYQRNARFNDLAVVPFHRTELEPLTFNLHHPAPIRKRAPNTQINAESLHKPSRFAAVRQLKYNY